MEENHVWIIRYEGGKFEFVIGENKREAVEARTGLNTVVTEVIDVGLAKNLTEKHLKGGAQCLV